MMPSEAGWLLVFIIGYTIAVVRPNRSDNDENSLEHEGAPWGGQMDRPNNCFLSDASGLTHSDTDTCITPAHTKKQVKRPGDVLDRVKIKTKGNSHQLAGNAATANIP